MRGAGLLLILLLGGAAACATRPDAPMEAAASSAPSPTPGYDWFLSEDGGTARLAYGVEASDDLKLALDCEKGAGAVRLTALAAPGEPAEIHLEAGGDTERYAARAEPSGMGDGLVLAADARLDQPVFQRFRSVGWIARLRGQARDTLVPQNGSGERVGRFFAFCG